MNKFRSQLELFLQAAGFTDREERGRLLDSVEEEILVRSYEKFKGKYSLEQFSKELKGQNEEIAKEIRASGKEVIEELFKSAIENASDEEREKFASLITVLQS